MHIQARERKQIHDRNHIFQERVEVEGAIPVVRHVNGKGFELAVHLLVCIVAA